MGLLCQLHKSRLFAAVWGPKWEWMQMVNLKDIFLLSTTAAPLLWTLEPSKEPRKAKPWHCTGRDAHIL